MGRVRPSRAIIAALHTMGERGGPLLLLLVLVSLVAGGAAYALDGMAPYDRIVPGVIMLLSWLAAATVALNLFGEERDLVAVTGLYDTTYHGMGWTLLHLVVGMLLYGIILGVALAPFWYIAFQTTPAIDTVLSTLAAGQVTGMHAALLLGYLILIAPAYHVAAAFLLFPVSIAVDNRPYHAALRASYEAVQGNTARMLPVVTLALAAVTLGPYAGWLYGGLAVPHALSIGLPFPAFIAAATRFATMGAFAAVDILFAAALITAVYGQTRDD